MSSLKAAKLKPTDSEAIPASPGSMVCGTITSVAVDGSFTVEYPGNEMGPIPAKTVVQNLWLGASVLLAFDSGDPTRPIVLGVVHDRIQTQGRTIHLKAAEIVLEATERLSIQCGEAAVEAERHGKLKLRGRDVLSRATRTNKVQGSTVQLN